MKEYKRLSSTPAFMHVLEAMIDARCWRTIYHLQKLWEERNGWMPSRDWVVSELLMDPARGARMLEDCRAFSHLAVPYVHSPSGNRYKRSVTPNAEYVAGACSKAGDWGKEAARNR